MNEIERRLRDHLRSVDHLPVDDAESVQRAAGRATVRIQRRRRTASVVGAMAVVAVGVGAVWLGRDDDSSSIGESSTEDATTTVATVATTVASTAVPSTTTVASTAVPTTLGPSGSWGRIAPDPRGATWAPSVVWTGTEALVVGGTDPTGAPRGGALAYDLAGDSWRTLADPPYGVEQINVLSVWTGSEMLVIGGDNPDGSLLVSAGYAYDPAKDSWRVIPSPPVGFITDRSPAVWTGSQLLVWPWDGDSTGTSTMAITPIAYDPSTDAWTALPEPPVGRRQSAASVWTGTEWIVWGGTTGTTELADGAAWNPASQTWRTLAPSPLSARRVRGVWTGKEMIVDAGSTGGEPITGNNELALADGGAYDPATDTWRTISEGLAHPGFVPVWTGSKVVMFAKGGAVVYDVASDKWIDTCCDGQGGFGTPVWTGSVVLLVGSGAADVGGSTFTPPSP